VYTERTVGLKREITAQETAREKESEKREQERGK
jgi:hypothetical protein